MPSQAPYGENAPLPGAPPPENPTLDPALALDDEPARPPEPAAAPFGAKGQFVLGGGTNVGLSWTQYDASAATRLSLALSPTVDYFVLRNVSIGLDLGVVYSDVRGYGTDGSLVDAKSSDFYGGPRLGLNLPFGSAASWWLLASAGIESVQTTTSLVSGSSVSTSSATGVADTSRAGPYVTLYLPLLVHPAPHFFMGFGPSLFHEFGALQAGQAGPNVGAQQTRLGAGFVVGGYWGGEPVATPHVGATPRPLRRLGEKGEFVFTNELGASLYSSAYAGTSSSSLNGSVALAFDYFLIDHFAVGFGGQGGGSTSAGTDGNGNRETVNTSSYGFFIRAVAQASLTGTVSLLPDLALGFGGGSYAATSGTGTASYTSTEVWLSAYLPIVVEVAPHFFAGFGPSISRDLSSTITFPQGPQGSNAGSTYGAGAVVGGWL